jgi:hypothetical protein
VKLRNFTIKKIKKTKGNFNAISKTWQFHLNWYLQQKQEYDEEKFAKYRNKKAAVALTIKTALKTFETWDELSANDTHFFPVQKLEPNKGVVKSGTSIPVTIL